MDECLEPECLEPEGFGPGVFEPVELFLEPLFFGGAFGVLFLFPEEDLGGAEGGAGLYVLTF